MSQLECIAPLFLLTPYLGQRSRLLRKTFISAFTPTVEQKISQHCKQNSASTAYVNCHEKKQAIEEQWCVTPKEDSSVRAPKAGHCLQMRSNGKADRTYGVISSSSPAPTTRMRIKPNFYSFPLTEQRGSVFFFWDLVDELSNKSHGLCGQLEKK